VNKIVVGLGNPGPEYAGTRHNVGYGVVERMAREAGTLFRPARRLEGYQGPRAFSWARLDAHDALLVRPETWMNLSGTVVAPILAFAGVVPSGCMVVYDDLDLPLGGLRLRPHGGAGGHRGVRSIIDELGTDRFPRLRIGIGRPRTDAARHVLERFSPKELEELAISLAEACEALSEWLATGDLEACMTRFHSRWNQGEGR
jgi:PTH1 family peptidyl-tRNA hydrolase